MYKSITNQLKPIIMKTTETFNKYKFLRDLTSELEIEIQNGTIADRETLQDIINEKIDNEVIYYADCFDICKELNVISFNFDAGTADNITQLAWFALDELISNELDYSELENLIESMDKSDFEVSEE